MTLSRSPLDWIEKNLSGNFLHKVVADEVHKGEAKEAKHIAGIEEDVGCPADGVDSDQLSLRAGSGNDDVKLLEEVCLFFLRGGRIRSHLHHGIELLNSGQRSLSPVLPHLNSGK